MNKLLLAGGLAVAMAGIAIAALDNTGRTTGATPVGASKPFSCADMSGTITTQGVEPDINCLAGGHLTITTKATPAPASSPKSRSQTTIRGSHGDTTVDIDNNSSSTQHSSSGSVHIEQHNSQSSRGNATNTNSSTTNITVTND